MSSADPRTMEAVARIATAATLLGLEPDTMVDNLRAVSDGLPGATVFTDADVRRFGLGADVPVDAWLPRRLASLAEGVSGSKALTRVAMARPGVPWVERGLGPDGRVGAGLAGLWAAASFAGFASLEDELAVAAAMGLPAEVAAALGAGVEEVTGHRERAERVVRVTIFSGAPGEDAMLELLAAAPRDLVARLASRLAGPQQRLLASAHPILASTGGAWVRVGATAAAVAPTVTVLYPDVSLDLAVSVLGGLASAPDAVSRLGTLAGALATDRARVIELTFGGADPVPVRIGLPVSR